MAKRIELLLSATLLGFGLLLIFVLIPGQIELPEHEVTMSPRLLPYLCALGIAALAGLQLVQVLMRREKRPGSEDLKGFSANEAKALVGITTLFIICIALFVYVAPLAAGVVLVVGLLVLLAERNLATYMLMPALLMFGAWFVFYKLLGTAIG